MGGGPILSWEDDRKGEAQERKTTKALNSIFHSDNYGHYLLANAPYGRWTNVYENSWGNRFYGSSCQQPPMLEQQRHTKRGHTCLYRIRVKLKEGVTT